MTVMIAAMICTPHLTFKVVGVHQTQATIDAIHCATTSTSCAGFAGAGAASAAPVISAGSQATADATAAAGGSTLCSLFLSSNSHPLEVYLLS